MKIKSFFFEDVLNCTQFREIYRITFFTASYKYGIICLKGKLELHREESTMECRAGCAACCIVVSISSSIPGMPQGKPAGVRCVQLTSDNRCKLFGKPERPVICTSLKPSEEMCGVTDEYAYFFLKVLEKDTSPGRT